MSTNIRDALIAADPAGADGLSRQCGRPIWRNSMRWIARCARRWRRFPPDRRKVISTHDAFGYFAAAYGIAFIAPLGVSTESEASARDIAAHHHPDQDRKNSGGFPGKYQRSAADAADRAETGARIGGTLYSDSLTGEKGDAPTYIDMVRHNIKALTSALAD